VTTPCKFPDDVDAQIIYELALARPFHTAANTVYHDIFAYFALLSVVVSF